MPQTSRYLIVCVGRDRVGILAELSNAIASVKGNIVDIRGEALKVDKMRLASITVLVESTPDSPPDFEEKLREAVSRVAKEFELKLLFLKPEEL